MVIFISFLIHQSHGCMHGLKEPSKRAECGQNPPAATGNQSCMKGEQVQAGDSRYAPISRQMVESNSSWSKVWMVRTEERRGEAPPRHQHTGRYGTVWAGRCGGTWGDQMRIIQRQRVQHRATRGLWNRSVTVVHLVNLKIEHISHFERHFVWDASSDIFTLGTRERLPSTLDPKVDWLAWTQRFCARAPCLGPLGKMVSGHGSRMPEHAWTRKWDAACDVRPSHMNQNKHGCTQQMLK